VPANDMYTSNMSLPVHKEVNHNLSFDSIRAIAGIAGAGQCFALSMSASVSSQTGCPRLSRSTGPSALQEPIESSGTGDSEAICAAADIGKIDTSAKIRKPRSMVFMLMTDTDDNPAVPLLS
jgi:hypothetical protein